MTECVNCGKTADQTPTAVQADDFIQCAGCGHDIFSGQSVKAWAKAAVRHHLDTLPEGEGEPELLPDPGKTGQALAALSHTLPVKVIEIDGTPYLERYFVGEQPDGTQHWLHHFLTADTDRHLHSHPWDATSTVLAGFYTERLYGDIYKTYYPGDQNHIPRSKLHQIVRVEPGTWTFMRVEPGRDEYWYFIEEKTGALQPMRSSGPEWYLGCKSRKEQQQ